MEKVKKRKISPLISISILIFLPAALVFGGLSFGGGYYTNLCGSGYDASFYACPANCNPESGSCSGNYVVRFTCDGYKTRCDAGDETWGTSFQVNNPHPGCDKTVQLDVFSKNCRQGGGWNCGDADLLGYMVWYSGACPNPPSVDIKASGSDGPITINHNAAATLTWATTNNPTSCTASNGWTGSKSTSGGSESTGTMATTKTFAISCSNGAGTAQDSVLVQVIYCLPTPPLLPI